MKKLNLLFSLVLLISGSLIFACTNSNSSTSSTSSKDSAESQNKSTFSNSKDDKNNAQFVVDVAAANYYEIGLSKYAAKVSTSEKIRDFAKMMVMDHSGALNKLKGVAQLQNIAIPNEDSSKVNDEIKSWQKKTPPEFNKDYVDEMVKEHQNAVDKLQKADSTITNADIHKWIEATLPTVKEHLQKVTDIQKSMKGA